MANHTGGPIALETRAETVHGRASAPPAVDVTYSATGESVGAARRRVARWLGEHAADALLVGDVALATSEACTNAVVHGYRNGSGGWFRVFARRDDDGAVRVIVTDGGCGIAPRSDSPGLGLGLPLMAELTEELDVRPASRDGGTVVSMLFRAEDVPPTAGHAS